MAISFRAETNQCCTRGWVSVGDSVIRHTPYTMQAIITILRLYLILQDRLIFSALNSS